MIDEHDLAISFRCFKGKGYFLGVKSPWWAHLMDEGEWSASVEVDTWRPSRRELTLAEKLLFDILLKLSEDERKVIIIRCGSGFVRSYRKCGKISGCHHEVFRQEFQRVMKNLNKVFDEN